MYDFDENKQGLAKENFEKSIDYIDEKDVEEALNSGEEKFKKLENDIPKHLKLKWEDLKAMLSLLKDFVLMKYRKLPFKSVAAVAAAVLYFVSPLDFLSDFIPILGYIDDAFILTICGSWVKNDLDNYKEWKSEPSGEE